MDLDTFIIRAESEPLFIAVNRGVVADILRLVNGLPNCFVFCEDCVNPPVLNDFNSRIVELLSKIRK